MGAPIGRMGAHGVGSRRSVVRPHAARRVLVVMVLLLASATMAAADASLTPVVDCVGAPGHQRDDEQGVLRLHEPRGGGIGSVWGTNRIVPGIRFQGQPTVFNTGTDERVFAASWSSMAFTQLAWDMNGLAAIADLTTQVCVAGITGTASDVTLSTASLHGDVGIGGRGHVPLRENGPDISTPTQTDVPTTSALVATNSDGLTRGALVTFATLAPPPAHHRPYDDDGDDLDDFTVTGATTTVTCPRPNKDPSRHPAGRPPSPSPEPLLPAARRSRR